MDVGFWGCLCAPGKGVGLPVQIPEVCVFWGHSPVGWYFTDQAGVVAERSCAAPSLLDELEQCLLGAAAERLAGGPSPQGSSCVVALLRREAARGQAPGITALDAPQLCELLEQVRQGAHIADVWSIQAAVPPEDNARYLSVYTRDPMGVEGNDVFGRPFDRLYASLRHAPDAPPPLPAEPAGQLTVPGPVRAAMQAKTLGIVRFFDKYHSLDLEGLVLEFVVDAALGLPTLHGCWCSSVFPPTTRRRFTARGRTLRQAGQSDLDDSLQDASATLLTATGSWLLKADEPSGRAVSADCLGHWGRNAVRDGGVLSGVALAGRARHDRESRRAMLGQMAEQLLSSAKAHAEWQHALDAAKEKVELVTYQAAAREQELNELAAATQDCAEERRHRLVQVCRDMTADTDVQRKVLHDRSGAMRHARERVGGKRGLLRTLQKCGQDLQAELDAVGKQLSEASTSLGAAKAWLALVQADDSGALKQAEWEERDAVRMLKVERAELDDVRREARDLQQETRRQRNRLSLLEAFVGKLAAREVAANLATRGHVLNAETKAEAQALLEVLGAEGS